MNASLAASELLCRLARQEVEAARNCSFSRLSGGRLACFAAMDADGNLPSVDDLVVVAEIAEAELSRLQALKAEFESKQQAAAAGRRALLLRDAPRKPRVSVKLGVDGARARVSFSVTEVRTNRSSCSCGCDSQCDNVQTSIRHVA